MVEVGETFAEGQWSSFFDGIIALLEESRRHYGYSNVQYAAYMLERLEHTIGSCRNLKRLLQTSQRSLQTYVESLQELLESLVLIRSKWQEYSDILDSRVFPSYESPLVHGNGRGRPRFEVSKEQIEYLVSLSFSYSEIASLLGVSRSTLYR